MFDDVSIGDHYMSSYGPVASGIIIIGKDDKFLYCERVHISYDINNKEKKFKLNYNQWLISDWIRVPMGTQLAFM